MEAKPRGTISQTHSRTITMLNSPSVVFSREGAERGTQRAVSNEGLASGPTQSITSHQRATLPLFTQRPAGFSAQVRAWGKKSRRQRPREAAGPRAEARRGPYLPAARPGASRAWPVDRHGRANRPRGSACGPGRGRAPPGAPVRSRAGGPCPEGEVCARAKRP